MEKQELEEFLSFVRYRTHRNGIDRGFRSYHIDALVEALQFEFEKMKRRAKREAVGRCIVILSDAIDQMKELTDD